MSHESLGSEEAGSENDEGLILIYQVCVAISNNCTYVIEGEACQMNNFKPDEIGNYAIGDMTLNKEQLEHFLGAKKSTADKQVVYSLVKLVAVREKSSFLKSY